MMFSETGPLPAAPEPPADDYPQDAVAPRFDEHGRKFMPEEPYPGILSIPIGPIDALALSLFWADAATHAARTGEGEVWSFSEERSAHFLRLARFMQPNCRDQFLSLSPDQIETLMARHSGGAA